MRHAGLVNGVLVQGAGEMLAVEDPSTEEVFANFPGCSAGQVESAILSARAAFDSGIWSGLSAQKRADALQGFIDAGCPRDAQPGPLDDVFATGARL